ncbi:hypothetical protein, partial [Bradyrhizobium liaoningense]|uniref:hypothetical protein n=1 Tax=Bradyrhizobium liaoningense TaxID=43992 RepID=UPI0024E10046
TARLKHLAIFPRKVDFSCFGYHPDLESRLTFQEKWVLAGSRGGVSEQCNKDGRPPTALEKSVRRPDDVRSSCLIAP